MKKILTIIALVCFFALGSNAKSNNNKLRKPSPLAVSANKNKVKLKQLFMGSCGYGLLYDSNHAVIGYWSCWEDADGFKELTIWKAPNV
jgi:hypothetical protein